MSGEAKREKKLMGRCQFEHLSTRPHLVNHIIINIENELRLPNKISQNLRAESYRTPPH